MDYATAVNRPQCQVVTGLDWRLTNPTGPTPAMPRGPVCPANGRMRPGYRFGELPCRTPMLSGIHEHG